MFEGGNPGACLAQVQSDLGKCARAESIASDEIERHAMRVENERGGSVHFHLCTYFLDKNPQREIEVETVGDHCVDILHALQVVEASQSLLVEAHTAQSISQTTILNPSCDPSPSKRD